LKNVELFIIKKKELLELYNNYKNIESLGRIMAEQVALRAIPFEVFYPYLAWICWVPNLLVALVIIRKDATSLTH
jgi:hypothetical protein